MNELTKWVITELSSLLQFPVTEDMAKCILMIESNRDLEEYMKTLVDFSNPTHQKFVKDLLKKKYLSEGYKKSKLEDYTEPSEKKDKKKGKTKNDAENKKNDQEEHVGKKKTKYVNIFSEDRQVVLLKGRHMCNCQASKHGLINNCIKCGRVVCEQEGSGPCFFCSHPVYTREELKKNPQLTKISSVLVPDSSLESAMELKERLLEYDKSSERRTRVIDDENDYFSTNSVWLSKEMKEELRKKEERLQELKHSRARSLIFDFTGRSIIDDEFKKLNLENSLLEEVTDLYDNSFSQEPFHNDNIDPKSTLDIEPVYEGDTSNAIGARWHSSMGRVQDRQLMEMADSGQCLSLHQPWATLLVEGIKVHEGRSWYTSHRGRLWIASAGKIPDPDQVEEVKDQYRLRIGEDVKLPSKYPTGCLLGCVTLTDCLAQEEYRTVYPDGESDEPFVFICQDPIKCPVLFPIKGKHKIYQLDKNIHEAAVKCIQKLARR